MRNTLLVVVLALSGCGKKGSEAKGGDCTASVNNAVTLSAEEFKKNGVTEATQQKIRDASITRCKEDKWSNEILKCFVDAKKSDDVSKCQQMMSKEQADNMSKAITGAMATQPDGSGSSSPPPETGSGDTGSAADGSGSSAATGLPPDCADYKAMIDKLAACDKMPAASRDMLKKSFDESSKAWADFDKLPADAKTALTASCKQGADALKKAAGPSCGF